jgi:hypothetical protein
LAKEQRPIEVLTLLRRERRWIGPQPASFRLVPNKPALEFNGKPTWAEFILLRLLERDGWNGAWVKNWGGREFWQDVGLAIPQMPAAAASLFERIEQRAGGRGGGCWDLVVSRGEECLFVESKQHGRDSLRNTQRIWIKSALEEAVPLSSFVIVEWAADEGNNRSME